MDYKKYKILLENFTDRGYNSINYGKVTADTFYFKVELNETVKDLGLYTDIEFLPKIKNQNTPPDYTPLINKLSQSGITFPFMTGAVPTTALTGNDYGYIYRVTGETDNFYFTNTNNSLTGITTSRLTELESYVENNPLDTNLSINSTYTDYLGNTINGVTKILSVGEPIRYVFDAVNNINIGTSAQTTGILYEDFRFQTYTYIDELGNTFDVPLTLFRTIAQGNNITNTSLSAITKEELYLGITSLPQTDDDIDIDRGITSVFDRHFRLSEIKNLGELKKYNGGYYNLNVF